MVHIIFFLRPLRYLNPGTGSILVQLIVAALGGGLFFFIKSKWNAWFKKGNKKANSVDDIEENTDEVDAPRAKTSGTRQPVAKKPSKTASPRLTSPARKPTTKLPKKRG